MAHQHLGITPRHLAALDEFVTDELERQFWLAQRARDYFQSEAARPSAQGARPSTAAARPFAETAPDVVVISSDDETGTEGSATDTDEDAMDIDPWE